jgi:hypothetical protein
MELDLASPLISIGDLEVMVLRIVLGSPGRITVHRYPSEIEWGLGDSYAFWPSQSDSTLVQFVNHLP